MQNRSSKVSRCSLFDLLFLLITRLFVFLVVVINEADSLSRDAQAALRRTMEKYMTNMRIILCANSTSKLIAPIKSRCLLMRVAAPSEAEIQECLSHVARKEKFDLPPSASLEIATTYKLDLTISANTKELDTD